MTPEILEWAKGVVTTHRLAGLPCLEVGSYDVNGSLRQLFTGPYLGVDQTDGPGVDAVLDIRELGLEDYFHVVVCTEVIEHDPRPWEVLERCAALLDHSGYLILTAPSIMFHRHDHPSDYYRFTAEGLAAIAESAGFEVLEVEELPGNYAPGKYGDQATSALVARIGL